MMLYKHVVNENLVDGISRIRLPLVIADSERDMPEWKGDSRMLYTPGMLQGCYNDATTMLHLGSTNFHHQIQSNYTQSVIGLETQFQRSKLYINPNSWGLDILQNMRKNAQPNQTVKS